MASNAKGDGMSDRSFSNSGRKNGGKAKGTKVRQRGMGIAELEHLRIQRQMVAATAASATNATAGSVVPNNLKNDPVYQLLDEGPRVNNPFYLSSLLASVPLFARRTPVTAPPASGPQGPQSEKMSMASKDSDIQLGRLSTSRLDEEEDDDLEFRQPNYFTRLLLDEDFEEETGQKNKRARTDSSGEGSAAAAGSSSSQEPNLELRLFF